MRRSAVWTNRMIRNGGSRSRGWLPQRLLDSHSSKNRTDRPCEASQIVAIYGKYLARYDSCLLPAIQGHQSVQGQQGSYKGLKELSERRERGKLRETTPTPF